MRNTGMRVVWTFEIMLGSSTWSKINLDACMRQSLVYSRRLVITRHYASIGNRIWRIPYGNFKSIAADLQVLTSKKGCWNLTNWKTDARFAQHTLMMIFGGRFAPDFTMLSNTLRVEYKSFDYRVAKVGQILVLSIPIFYDTKNPQGRFTLFWESVPPWCGSANGFCMHFSSIHIKHTFQCPLLSVPSP